MGQAMPSWQCQNCGYHNSLAVAKCGMCGGRDLSKKIKSQPLSKKLEIEVIPLNSREEGGVINVNKAR